MPCSCINLHPLLHIYLFIFKLLLTLDGIPRKRSSRRHATLPPALQASLYWLLHHHRQVAAGHCIGQMRQSAVILDTQPGLHGKIKLSALKKKVQVILFQQQEMDLSRLRSSAAAMATSFHTHTALGPQGCRDPRDCLRWQDLGVCGSWLWGCAGGTGFPRDMKKRRGLVLEAEGVSRAAVPGAGCHRPDCQRHPGGHCHIHTGVARR